MELLSQLESFLVATFIGGGVVTLLLVIFVLLLRLAPAPLQERVKAGIIRWNGELLGVFDRAIYASAVLLVFSITISLLAVVVYLFVK